MPYTRRHPRFRLTDAQLTGQMTFASQVSILDIALGGVSVRADKRLNIGGTYMLKLVSGQESLSLRCEVAWARLSGTRRNDEGESVAVYTAGMQFVDSSPEQLATLQSFIDAVGARPTPVAGDRRSHPRFPPAPPGLALLDVPFAYSVTTISLGGMLIRCSTVVEPETLIPMQLTLQGRAAISFRGRVVSCQPTTVGTTESYYAGIEFIGLPESGRDSLATFIAGLGPANE